MSRETGRTKRRGKTHILQLCDPLSIMPSFSTGLARLSGARGLTAAAIACTTVAGAVMSPRSERIPSAKAIEASQRPAKLAELAAAPPGFVLIAGDSHAAALRLPCDSVNLAVPGLKARDVRDQLAALPPLPAPHAMLLVVGTNDLLRKHRPLARIDAWIADVRRSVARFRKVVLVAVPPIGTPLVATFDPEGIARYSQRLEALCSEIGCSYVDPWLAARSRIFGEARSGALDDHLHMADYGPAGRALAPLLCPNRDETPEGIAAAQAR